jgi:gliding motility-associated-like protein
MRKKILLAFLLFAGFASRGQIILNESFNVSTITATPPTGWTAGSSTGTQNGCSVNGTTIMQVPSGGFVCTVNGANLPAPTANSGAGMAGYNSWDITTPAYSEWASPVLNFSTSTSGYVLSFWVYQGQYGYNVPDSLKVYVNTTTSSTGGTRLYADNPNFSASPKGWAQYTIPIPATYNGTTNYIIFRAESGYGYNMHWDDVIVKSQAPPAPTVTNNTPVCPGGTVTITGTVAAGYTSPSYTLTGPAGFTPQNNTTGVFTVSTNASTANNGVYSMTVTSGGFTSAASTTTVNVYGTPRSITAGNVVVPTTCLGTNGSFQITGMNPTTTYTLIYRKNAVTITPSLSITSDASGNYTVTNLGVGSYDSIRVISGAPSNCISNIIVNPVIIPSPTPPTKPKPAYNNPLCPGSTLNLSVTNTAQGVPGSTYYWTGPGGFNTSSSPTTTGSATRPGANSSFNGIYTVTVTTPNGCVSQDTMTVTVRNPDPAPIPSNITYCQYDIALPLVAAPLPGATLNWYDTNGANPAIPGPILPLGAPTPNTNIPTPFPTNIIYYVSQTLVCESPKVPLYVIVKPKPQPPFVQDSTIDYCQYEVVGPLAAGGQNIRWFSTPSGGTGTATAPVPSTLVPGTYFYYASQTVDGCESDRRTIRVIVKPKPEPPKVTSPVNLCQGDPIAPLTAIGKDLLWYTIPAGGVGVPVAPIINTGYEDSFVYYVTQTVNGCESDRALISAYVRYKPNGIITASQQSVCQDAEDSFFYYGNARDDAEFVWFAPLSAHFVSGQGTSGPVVIHFDTSGTSVVQLIINNKGCISRLVAAPITVRPLPHVEFVNRQDVCEDDLLTVALKYTEPFVTGYHWDFGADDYILEYGVLTTGGPFGVRYPTPGQYEISVTATKDACISKPVIQTVYVHARPDATISWASNQNPNDFCASDTLNLSVPSVPEGASYHWSPAAYFQSHADTLNNQVAAVVSQTSTVKVNVRSSFGCEANDSLRVNTKPCCGVYFPNSFSPNGDGRNDLFRPITQGVHKVNTFRIINRWGQVVYESKVERDGWDGKFNSTPQDMGTYYYYISYKCEGKDQEEKGEFILMR